MSTRRRMGRARVHPIEAESMRILAGRLDLSALPPLSRAVTARIIHSTADLGWVGDLMPDEPALRRGWQALAAGAPIVADGRMVAAGITSAEVQVPIAEPVPTEPSARTTDSASATRSARTTRSAAAVARAAQRVGPGAVWVVGTAPTALAAVVAHARDPALVVGLPVGFVGAVAAKVALRASKLPALYNRGERGGAAAAAAAVNALLYLSPSELEEGRT